MDKNYSTIMDKNKVLYLTCLENTCNNDIHQSQVLGLRNQGVDYVFLFISPLFILGKAGFHINRNIYKEEDVKEVKIPIFSACLVMYLFLIPYYLLVACPILLYYLHKEKISVVHCRNLVSALLAVFCKVFLFKNIKVVCDPRSVYVEEGVIIGRFKYNGITYKGWKKLEKWIYKKSDFCLGLSENFTNYLKQYNKNSLFIPAVVRPSFTFDGDKRKELRQIFGLTDKHKICIYVGSIGLWHSVKCLLAAIDSYQNTLCSDEHIKIIFLSGNKKACEAIRSHFPSNDILKCGRVPSEEVLDYLQIADFGIVPGTDRMGFCYNLLYETMLSSKAEEFLSAGLPIITSDRIVSLVDIVKKYGVGLIYNGSEIISNNTVFNRDIISSVFNKKFNAKAIVTQYKDLYIKN